MVIKCKQIKIRGNLFIIPEKELINNDIYSVILILKDDINVIEPYLAFTIEKSEEDFDYDYDENLVCMGINTNIMHYPITHNPLGGEKITFEICSTEDKTDEYNEILALEESYNKKRKSKEKFDVLRSCYNKKLGILNKIPPLFYFSEDAEFYGEFDMVDKK